MFGRQVLRATGADPQLGKTDSLSPMYPREIRRFAQLKGVRMPKHYMLGLPVLAVGAGAGLFIGGNIGLVLAATCLVLGLLYLMEPHARRTRAVGAQATRPAHQKTELLFLIKEIHARPHRAGKFHELREVDDTLLDFELFLYCWLVNQTELPLRIVEGPQLKLQRSAAPIVIAERIANDLDRWRLGKLSQELDSSDMLVVRATQESISEFDTGHPLECGAPLKGWLHFRVKITAAELKASTLELSITDSLSNFHVSTTSGPQYIPGRIWPFLPTGLPETAKTEPQPVTPLNAGTLGAPPA